MVTKRVAVTQVVEVTVDESKFDEAFMSEFRASFYPFNSVDRHIEHLAQLRVRGMGGDSIVNPDPFIEGYGNASEMGIRFKDLDNEMEIEIL